MRALISIHDVMPETLDAVGGHIERLRAHGHQRVTLLIVPGRQWDTDTIGRLAQWQREGLELAAHGWHHQVERLGGPYHWLHAALISRRCAEHLALDAPQIVELMEAAADWFSDQGLKPPETYVPPAWALGSVSRNQLSRLPYRRVEITRGLLSTIDGRLDRLPLVGFEADTAIREHLLRHWNHLQTRWAWRRQRPLRIGIHPHDHELRLADDLQRLVSGDWVSMCYRDYAIA